MVERDISVERGQSLFVKACLRRTVDPRGWVSADFHSHSTLSGDNLVSVRDRIINLVAEHIEFAPTTEHNRIEDWTSEIDQLGLGHQLRSVSGIELTGSGQHFNAFPIEQVPFAQSGGAPQWQPDPLASAALLRVAVASASEEGGWVQLNHPLVGEVFSDRDRDGVPDGGYAGLEGLIDAAEFGKEGDVLSLIPMYEELRHDRKGMAENRTFGWLQLLIQGCSMTGRLSSTLRSG